MLKNRAIFECMAWTEAYSQQQAGFDRSVAVHRQVVRRPVFDLGFAPAGLSKLEFSPQESVAVHHQKVQAATSIR